MRIEDRSSANVGMVLVATLFAAAGLVTLWGFAITLYPRLPALIPLHFNGRGEPDRWEVTTPMAWYQLPGIATGIVLLMVGTAWFCLWAAARKPQLVNIPFKERFLAASPSRRAWIIEPIAASLALDGVAISGLFLHILQGTERVANGAWPGLPPVGFAVLIPLLIVTPLAGTVWTSWRAGKT
jgi:hypothetical protein